MNVSLDRCTVAYACDMRGLGGREWDVSAVFYRCRDTGPAFYKVGPNPAADFL